MSNYDIQSWNSDLKVMLGWDPPLNTFFAHVIDTSKNEGEEGREVLWIGCTFNEIHDREKVVDAVTPYAEVSEEIYNQLYADANT